MHIVEGLVDLVQRLAVGDELIHLQLAIHVVLDKSRQLGTALDASESAAAPASLQVVRCQCLCSRETQA